VRVSNAGIVEIIGSSLKTLNIYLPRNIQTRIQGYRQAFTVALNTPGFKSPFF